MELVLSFEPPWVVKRAPDRRRVAIGADMVITYGPLDLDLVLERDVPAGARLVVTADRAHATRDGWPLRLVDAQLVGVDGPVEARLYACYTFLAHTATAIVRSADAAAIDARRAALVAIFEQGRPDWRGHPICLADAWDVAASAPIDARARAHHERGISLGDRGEHAAAAAEWQRAVELAPDYADAHYNLGQARYRLGDVAAALASFEAVRRSSPDDVLVERKIIQCLHALGRDAEALAARERFRVAWASSRDPRVRTISEYVFDQFAADGFSVHAIETLRPKDPTCYPVVVFRAMRGPHDDIALPVAVLVETSDAARAAGTPFVLGVVVGGTYRVVGTRATLPVHAQLKAEVLPLLVEAMRAISG